jgi:hypothetical protein
MKEPQDEAQRRHAISWAIALTAETHLAPEQYETELLEEYAQGKLTLDQVLHQLDSRVQHILYRSEAVHPLSSEQCTELLEQSRSWNEQHQITGLLCYSSSGHFVQVIEGPAKQVHTLFAKIRQDRRHTKVMLLSDKASATRWFAGWEMAYVETKPQDLFWVMGYLDAKSSNLLRPQRPIVEPELLRLLDKFSHI